MEGEVDESALLLESSRFWIQRVLVPIVVFIGITGNAISVVVLTRKKMLCTTTIYLTALAVADIIYLAFVLILSFRHYPNIHLGKYEFYWSFYAISHWICDTASNTSVWLTVSFTLERYIVVCYPIKGKVLCTEGRAKCIIAIVYITSMIAAFSTLFEYELNSECLEYCPPKNLDPLENINSTCLEEMVRYQRALEEVAPNNKDKIYDILKHHEVNNTEHLNATIHNINKHFELAKKVLSPAEKVNVVYDSNSTEHCCNRTIGIKESKLGLNETYRIMFFWFTSLFYAIVPVIVVATVNCILVYSMFQSRTRRKRMTIRRRENATQNHENRITLLLVVVVFLFLICQTPTASFLIYDTLDQSDDPVRLNYKKVCGNIFNFLINLNAALNFVMYCVFSNKYRTTFKELFCQKKLAPQDQVLGISRLSTRKILSGKDAMGCRRNNSEYLRTPRNLETCSLPLRSKSLMTRNGRNEIYRI